jgi:hypothetical protein
MSDTPTDLAAAREVERKAWWNVADPADVHRVCHLLRIADDKACKHCPASEELHGEKDCTRGCYALANEIVNTVQTGNPWRKTEGVKPPWAVLATPPPEQDQ